MGDQQDYWEIYMLEAAEECGIELTKEQLAAFCNAAASGHDHYGMAFYSPPPSERISEIEKEHEEKLKALRYEFDSYRSSAEKAVKRALKINDSYHVSIEENGDVLRHGGRPDRIL